MSLISIQTKPQSGPETLSGPKYWRSLDQLADAPAFREWVEREFPSSAADMLDGNSRRTVLKLMAASFGLAGLTACTRPVRHALPFSKGVEDFIPGQAYFYSTAMQLGGQVSGLLVETHDGRPTKIEGNPDHPASLGAATAMQQASVLSLYDPDRSGKVLERSGESSWQKFEAAVKALSLGDGSGLRFLSETVTSPSLAALRAQTLAKFPKAKWIEYEAISRENERAGTVLAFGQELNVHPQFDKAKVILALDSDFLGLDSATPLATKQYSKRRRIEVEGDLEKVNRLYAVESQFSITGANADHRLRMRAAEVKQFAIDLAMVVGALPSLNVLGNGDKRSKFLDAVAKDLKAAGSQAVVVAGPRQPASVHALAYLINQSLGSLGAAFTFTKPEAGKAESGSGALKALAGEMSGGQVSTLVILGGNPAYTAPADVAFATALAKVANSIHLGVDEDETAAAVGWHVPEAHYLESWSDVATSEGVVSIQQPMIEPLYGVQNRGRDRGAAARCEGSARLRHRQEFLDFAVARGVAGAELAESGARRPGRFGKAGRDRETGARRKENRRGGCGGAEAGLERDRSGLRSERGGLGWNVRQQRLDAGGAGPDHQAGLGQRRDDLSGERARRI